MKLSDQTLEVLKNFSDINTNILVKPGSELSTISTMKNILAKATITESFDKQFAVYDLSELLGIVSAIEKPDVDISNEKFMTIGSTFNFKTENLKIIPGDYDVAVSSKSISHFKNKVKPIEYWIALEPDSKISK